MQIFSAEAQAQLEERRGTNAKTLLWFEAENRETGAPETLGFWNGDDHEEFLIDGEIRTFYGAGNVIDVPPIVVKPGFTVRNLRIKMPPFTDEVKTLLEAYKPRLAKVLIYSVALNIDTGGQMGTPVRAFKGFLNQAPQELGPKNGSSYTELVLVTAARHLTYGLPLKRSSAELQRRNGADKGREYCDVAGEWTIPWGRA
ncbi:hypothetical protein [Phaeobacter sp. 11ANDIMAR09]|uniref:hypothetical protein n=1 Tax=Phaeobacter sp. 11ANDIMAR09 TaxID=1225647 RepID=UPI0006C84864|nr:hypothetical protein [Phaeobacter sp. 11ANDIMAR09]KPD10861.1 hypothetical protein AN476_18575 [Phaeobacter sp. 11ANDIMAR09]